MYRKVSKIGGYNAASPTVGELKTTYAPFFVFALHVM